MKCIKVTKNICNSVERSRYFVKNTLLIGIGSIDRRFGQFCEMFAMVNFCVADTPAGSVPFCGGLVDKESEF